MIGAEVGTGNGVIGDSIPFDSLAVATGAEVGTEESAP